jgi:N-alpha-acetyl-L-2,4-diaminobutyrate deacetylase
MNRAFPGRPDGTVTEMIAHFLSTVLFPLSDIVIDIHTGGRSMDFVPCATMHLVADRDQRKQMVQGVLAWNSDFAFLYTDIAGTGLLPVEAENQGKIVVTTEMGGGEPISPAVHALTQSGLANVLIHFGLLAGDKQDRAGFGLPPTRWVQALGRDDYRFAPESGVYENFVPLGQTVSAGQPLGQVHFLERPDRDPVQVAAANAGVLMAARGPALVSQGDCVACIAQEVDPAILE